MKKNGHAELHKHLKKLCWVHPKLSAAVIFGNGVSTIPIWRGRDYMIKLI